MFPPLRSLPQLSEYFDGTSFVIHSADELSEKDWRNRKKEFSSYGDDQFGRESISWNKWNELRLLFISDFEYLYPIVIITVHSGSYKKLPVIMIICRIVRTSFHPKRRDIRIPSRPGNSPSISWLSSNITDNRMCTSALTSFIAKRRRSFGPIGSLQIETVNSLTAFEPNHVIRYFFSLLLVRKRLSINVNVCLVTASSICSIGSSKRIIITSCGNFQRNGDAANEMIWILKWIISAEICAPSNRT